MSDQDEPKTLPLAPAAAEGEASCDSDGDCCSGVDRRDFIRLAGLGAATAAAGAAAASASTQGAAATEVLEKRFVAARPPVVCVASISLSRTNLRHSDRVKIMVGLKGS